MPVNTDINIPIEVTLDTCSAIVEVVGKTAKFISPAEKKIETVISSASLIKSCIQYKEGDPENTVNVRINNKNELIQCITNGLKNTAFHTSVSMSLTLSEHLDELMTIRFNRLIGLKATSGIINVKLTDETLLAISTSLINTLDSADLLRQYIFEQLFALYPERFEGPGLDDTYKQIPFQSGDSITFYLVMPVDTSKISMVLNYGTFIDRVQLPTMPLLPIFDPIRIIIKFILE